jgi:hypothetical protein
VDSDALRGICLAPLLCLLTRAASTNCSHNEYDLCTTIAGESLPVAYLGTGGENGAVIRGVKGQAAEKN